MFDDLVAELPDRHRAEFFRNHEAGISPNDVELARPRSVLIQWRAQGVIQVSAGKKREG